MTKHISRSINNFPALTISLIALLFSLSAPTTAQTIGGRVIGITDGDTITVLDASNEQHKIRLNGIDAPESGQDFGQVSKRKLSGLIFGKEVLIEWRKIDRYGRIIGKVRIGAIDVNLEQIRAGLAWYFRKYASDVSPADRPLYDRAEQEARATRRGLWQEPNPTPPWDYRAEQRGEPIFPGEPTPQPQAGRIIGNRNSRIYHRPDCPSYNDVSERNRVYFETAAEAEAAGFRMARNCPR